ncbi:MAG: RNA polymerase subunit sigma-70 [Zetaproteobacteria bacterium CG06_land_8_20_14_3_00_59_53]|nr:MAG: RNA polymerase subunit sigma-70 [Zetaproteobacteria bacterium CG2_30_59_37]PIO90661.1 MAG: RNA polymerase subunit sigma-70 [Zetaproteobacteria bacterium CG23_combo_of_CG06-09_8_20_14_all_59_86]PIQ66075.1 MAG: RNA polymerase subunit sigma-70 [Zetaproteobacteria bacterium CG11_big_fil_rev_8_21_14_0_20_59_439]PIU71607.1 MAG: RNA polymerase subunit sigma-70 [Zetaproteobacteria bacterium CG06_land_8_20_14_3_00_59_53]PIU97869.1 MAG: RNA polymerase subunit sigma-70 [Zetaproteobacteria bacteriu
MTDTQDRTRANPEYWLQEHGDYLYGYAMSRLSDTETARDIVQETLIAAWKSKKSFRGDSSARTWLIGIMKHKIIDHVRSEIRKRKLSEELERDPTSDFFDTSGQWLQPVQAWQGDPEQLSQDQQFASVLQSCIAALPEQQREVFTLRELSGEDSDSICNNFGISATNLHVIMHRARMALRRCLEINWFGGAKAR